MSTEKQSAENDAAHCALGLCAALSGHDGTCDEASGWVITCDDLGCVDGKTVQGRKYHHDGEVEEQWAPCGRHASTCSIPPAMPTTTPREGDEMPEEGA